GLVQTVSSSTTLLINRINPILKLSTICTLVSTGMMKSGAAVAFHYALGMADLSTISTIYALLPFVTILIARLVLKEKITVFEIILSTLCFGGIMCTVYFTQPKGSHKLGTYILGVILVFFTVVGNSAFYVYVRYNTLKQERSQDVNDLPQTLHSDDKNNNERGKPFTQESLTTDHKLFLETEENTSKLREESEKYKDTSADHEKSHESDVDYRLPIFYSSVGYLLWYILIRLITQQPFKICLIADEYLVLL
uniref:EamA domain-containing protein n=1 Tax=Clytia hemisphaerica TaxID=252671 RepID=A0A7M5XDP6_9CNID